MAYFFNPKYFYSYMEDKIKIPTSPLCDMSEEERLEYLPYEAFISVHINQSWNVWDVRKNIDIISEIPLEELAKLDISDLQDMGVLTISYVGR